MASSLPRSMSVWHRATRMVVEDRRGLVLGIACGILAVLAIGIDTGFEAGMVAFVTIVGLAIQFRMFLAFLRAIEGAIRRSLDRKETVLGLVLLALAASIQAITKVPVTATTAFSAVAAVLLFGVIKLIQKRR